MTLVRQEYLKQCKGVRGTLRTYLASNADITLLAEVNQAHERLSGLAMGRILQREWEVLGKREYQRQAGISVSQKIRRR